MKSCKSDIQKQFEKAFDAIGDLTPLKSDCGVLCDKACCKGDSLTGMRLFPHEETAIRTLENGNDNIRLCVCRGECERQTRPLACRMFPLFPVVHKNGTISAEIDVRAIRLCPMVANCDKVRFCKDFRKAVRKAGRILYKNAECREYLIETTAEIEQYAKLYGFNKQISKRK